jgi:hypothetical protein
MDISRRVVAIALLAIAYNFIFLASSKSHVLIGLIWLAVDVVVWWPDLYAKAKKWI